MRGGNEGAGMRKGGGQLFSEEHWHMCLGLTDDQTHTRLVSEHKHTRLGLYDKCLKAD